MSSVILFGGREERPGPEYFECPEKVSTGLGRVFEIGERIKAGGNGVVHKCTDASTGIDYAIKFQLDLRRSRVRRFSREQKLLSELKHDHLMMFEGQGMVSGTKVIKRSGKPARKTQVTLPFLVMPLARCNLSESIKADEVPSEVYFAQFRGLARALGALHEKAIHRDIKPENILIVGERWVISDYGLCDVQDGSGDCLTPNWEIVGPRFWMSPEANNRSVGHDAPISTASDVFQLASVFWFVVNRCHPTGILSRDDWNGPAALFDPIYKALHYNVNVRPTDGKAFADMIDVAVLS